MTYIEYKGYMYFGKRASELFNNLKMQEKYKEKTCCKDISKVGEFKMIGDDELDFPYRFAVIKECPTCRRVKFEEKK